MNTNKKGALEHAQVLEYLPQFVNKTLEPALSSRVEKHLSACDDCTSALEFEQKLQLAAARQDDVSAIAMRNLEKLNARIEASIQAGSSDEQAPAAGKRGRDHSVVSRLQRLLQSLVPSPQLGGALAMGVCAVFVFGVLSPSNPVGEYEGPGSSVNTRGDKPDNDPVCKSSEDVVMESYQYHVEPAGSKALDSTHVDRVVSDTLPGSDYSLSVQDDGSLLLTLDINRCGVDGHRLRRTLQEQVSETVSMKNVKATSGKVD